MFLLGRLRRFSFGAKSRTQIDVMMMELLLPLRISSSSRMTTSLTCLEDASEATEAAEDDDESNLPPDDKSCSEDKGEKATSEPIKCTKGGGRKW